MNWEDYVAHEHNGQKGHGTLKILKGFHSPQLDNKRDIVVYLPPSYGTADRRYPVVYMHDGQNLFDPRTSFAGEWKVDEALDRASGEGVEAIVVGIPNTGPTRASEYSPFDDARHGPGRGDAYLAFIIDTLKPIIDSDFRTEPSREHTGLAGSSMGGLISLYGFFKRSDIFGFAGVMSASLWYAQGSIFNYLDSVRHVPGRLYVDIGTHEGKQHLEDVMRLKDRLLALGYREDHDLLHVVARNAAHNEAAWARRVGRELRFLLGRAATRREKRTA